MTGKVKHEAGWKEYLPWVIVVGGAVFGPRLMRWTVPGWVSAGAAPALVLALVAVTGYALLRARTRSRRQTMARLAEGLVPLLGRSLEVSHVKGSRWRRGRPRRVVVQYPGEVDDRDQIWRTKVVALIGHRMGATTPVAEWDTHRGVLTVQEASAQATVAEVDRTRATARVSAILTPLFGVEITVTIPSWTGEKPERVTVRYGTTTRDTSPLWQSRIVTILGLKVGGRWRANFEPTRDRVTFVPRPELPEEIPHPGTLALGPELRPDRPVLPYGVDEDDRVVAWSPADPVMAHALVIGPTGGGKTTWLRSVVVAATGLGMLVFGVDPKRIELTPFRGWPGVPAVASTPADMAKIIEAIHAEMMRRYAILERGGDVRDLPRIVLIIDEYLVFVAAMNRLWAQSKPKGSTGSVHPVLGLITELLVMARASRTHLVIGIQRPDASVMGDKGARDNLRHRISLTRLSREGSQMLWGNPYTGIDLPLKAGRAMGAADGQSPVEMQTWWLSDPRRAKGDDARVMDELRQRAAAAQEGLKHQIDLDGLSAQAMRYLVADEPLVITAPAQIPSDVAGEIVTQSAVRDDRAAGLDVQDVTADALMPGDRVLTDSGMATVRSVEIAAYDDEVVEIDLGAEVLALGRTDLMPRVLDLTEDTEATPGGDEYDDDFNPLD